MKNKIEFSGKEKIQKGQFIDQNNAMPITDENQKSDIKSSHKVIKGKVKVYHNHKTKFTDDKHLDNNAELLMVSERMMLFLKFTFILIILFFIYMEIRSKV